MLFGTDVNNLPPGSIATVDDNASFHPRKLSTLAPGNYLAQAVLDMHQDDSNWRREPGNLFSPSVVAFTVTDAINQNRPEDVAAPQSSGEPGRPRPGPTTDHLNHIALPLPQIIQPTKYPTTQGAELFEMPSQLLSEFHHRPIMLRLRRLPHSTPRLRQENTQPSTASQVSAATASA